jgi:hypothetical protein
VLVFLRHPCVYRVSAALEAAFRPLHNESPQETKSPTPTNTAQINRPTLFAHPRKREMVVGLPTKKASQNGLRAKEGKKKKEKTNIKRGSHRQTHILSLLFSLHTISTTTTTSKQKLGSRGKMKKKKKKQDAGKGSIFALTHHTTHILL